MSNVKRKDNKGRNLRLGESQRKDGRYVYKYTDIYGKPQFKYAWKLVPTDKTPAGKREDLSLREKEKHQTRPAIRMAAARLHSLVIFTSTPFILPKFFMEVTNIITFA